MKTGYPSIDKTHLQGLPEEKLHPEIFPISMFTTFMKINGEHLDEIAVEANGNTYTKQTLKNDIARTAGFFLGMGLTAGDKIIIATPNCYEGIVITFSANAVGIQVVMIDPVNDSNLSEFYEELKVHEPDLVMLYGKSCRYINKIKKESPISTSFLEPTNGTSISGNTLIPFALHSNAADKIARVCISQISGYVIARRHPR